MLVIFSDGSLVERVLKITLLFRNSRDRITVCSSKIKFLVRYINVSSNGKMTPTR
jgi:hypothetical protein